MHQLVLRQCEPNSSSELAFLLGGEVRKFGLKEFALVTGLNCSPYPEETKKTKKMLADEINKKFFSGSKSVKGKEITMIFSGSIEASDEEKVKLAKLFLLECVLFAKQKAGIDMTHIPMANDDDAFDSYSWGRLVFEHTIDFF